MTINISTQARNDAGDAIVDLIDLGSTNPNGYIEIRDGVKPVNPQTGIGATVLLTTMNFSLPAFGNFSNGISLANSIANDTNVDETGVATWFRIYDRNGTAIMDGDITIAGGGDIEFDNVNFIKGGVVAITSLTPTMPS